MKNSNTKLATIALAAFITCASASAAQAELNIVSGGVGEGGIATMEQMQNEYSLKAVFSGNGGMYLSNVNVRILTRAGEEVTSLNTDGPVLLAQLPAGRYVLEASLNDSVKRVNVTVPRTGLRTVDVRLPVSDNSYTATTGEPMAYTANGRSVKGPEPYYDPDFQATGYYDPSKDTVRVQERGYYPNRYYLMTTDWELQKRGHDSGIKDMGYRDEYAMPGDAQDGSHATRGRDGVSEP